MNDVLYLPVSIVTKGELNQVIQKKEYTNRIFCEKGSATRTEFFSAGQNGLKPQYMFKVYQIDYNKEDSLMYEDNVYKIYRTYETKDERIELYCEVKSGGN